MEVSRNSGKYRELQESSEYFTSYIQEFQKCIDKVPFQALKRSSENLREVPEHFRNNSRALEKEIPKKYKGVRQVQKECPVNFSEVPNSSGKFRVFQG